MTSATLTQRSYAWRSVLQNDQTWGRPRRSNSTRAISNGSHAPGVCPLKAMWSSPKTGLPVPSKPQPGLRCLAPLDGTEPPLPRTPSLGVPSVVASYENNP